jgi:hypothetical protein
VYVILKLTVEALADGGLKLSGTFGEEIPVWEDVRTSRRCFSTANPPWLRFTLISKDGRLSPAFHLDNNARGGFRKLGSWWQLRSAPVRSLPGTTAVREASGTWEG